MTQDTPETIFRRKMLSRMSLVSAILFTANYMAHFLNEKQFAFSPIIASLTAFMFLLAVWISHRRLSLASALLFMFIGMTSAVLAAFTLRGGFHAPAVALLILFPVMGYCFAGSLAGKAGTFVALSLAALFLIVDQAAWLDNNAPILDYSSTYTITLITLIIFSSSLGYTLNRARKVAEQRLVETSGLVNLGIMAGGIAHEINNPLAIIQGYTHQLTRITKSDPIDAAKLTQLAPKFIEATNRIAAIIDGLIVYSRDQTSAIMEPTSLNPIIERCLQLCGERFARKNIDLKLDMSPEEKMVLAQPMQLSQAILNLLNNAYDAVEDRPVKEISVVVTSEQNTVVIKISDSGLGVPNSIREQVFVPFFTTKQVGKGTGLGLSLSSSIVSAHGGEIILMESMPTTFMIRLPTIS